MIRHGNAWGDSTQTEHEYLPRNLTPIDSGQEMPEMQSFIQFLYIANCMLNENANFFNMSYLQ